MPGRELGAPPHEAVTTQQLANPIGAQPDLRALLQVGRQPCSCPPREGEAQVSRILLYSLHQQFEVGRRDACWAAGVDSRGQAPEPEQTPTTSAVMDRTRSDAQRLRDAAGALPLGTP